MQERGFQRSWRGIWRQDQRHGSQAKEIGDRELRFETINIWLKEIAERNFGVEGGNWMDSLEITQTEDRAREPQFWATRADWPAITIIGID